ncbi:MAG: low affinity iron permease family protein [Niastella sp.]|nr:low affinity iron permease family protein [Niastella sp.]
MTTKQSEEKDSLKWARLYNKISGKLTRASGSPIASIMAFLLIIGWALCGPIFHFSDTWQLVINTSTTIITFLMVFIIQQTQNKDTTAIHLKLNELIACHEKASNRLVDIEDLTEEELSVIKKYYTKLSDLSEKENDLYSSHSLDEAEDNHEEKSKKLKKTSHA